MDNFKDAKQPLKTKYGVYKERQFDPKIKFQALDLPSIVVKTSYSVVKTTSMYVNAHYIDVLCISWTRPINMELAQIKKGLAK
ncbi:hypothetical protein [Flagellimonas sediminis]|mgnify:CR=1 FL=1|uniref:Uncharacterized protein n=1 Tax=Flagellimonas sediminis TaxID=2696468 RepID=A0A6I5KQG2_9FLAO|nr:hypothetical protein [Allomuricauda sediminis]NDV42747.1 hypothetical protein [Allomuricauda sediminis]